VDRRRLRVRHRVLTGIATEAISWPAPKRILAYLQGGTVAVVDAERGEVIRRRHLETRRDCCVDPMASVPGGAAVLSAPVATRSLALSLFDVRGNVRTVELNRVRLPAGQAGRFASLASDGGGRVFAGAPHGPLAVVDTRSERTRYIKMPRSPACPRERSCDRYRTLIWLGDGLVAVNDSSRDRGRSWLVELGTGRVRPLSSRPYLTYGGGILVAYGRGLAVFDRHGSRLWSALARRTVVDVQSIAGLTYATTTRRRRPMVVFDTRTGRGMGRSRLSYVRFVSRP
jgi:hypothetical protein